MLVGSHATKGRSWAEVAIWRSNGHRKSSSNLSIKLLETFDNIPWNWQPLTETGRQGGFWWNNSLQVVMSCSLSFERILLVFFERWPPWGYRRRWKKYRSLDHVFSMKQASFCWNNCKSFMTFSPLTGAGFFHHLNEFSEPLEHGVGKTTRAAIDLCLFGTRFTTALFHS